MTVVAFHPLGNFILKPFFISAICTAVIAVAGYTLVHFLQFQNAYWVLPTVLIVMKPNTALGAGACITII